MYTDRAGRRYDTPEALPADVATYRWQGAFGIPRLLKQRAELARLGPERYRAGNDAERRQQPASRARAAEARLPAILAQLDGRKAWVEKGELRSGTFVRNCKLILDAIEQGR